MLESLPQAQLILALWEELRGLSRFTSSRTKCLSQKERLSLLRPPR